MRLQRVAGPLFGGWALLALSLVLPGPAQGQGLQGLVDSCAQRTGGLAGRCHVAGLALEAVGGGAVTGASMGASLPGSASTLGHRLQGFPRTSLALRVGVAGFAYPDLTGGYSLPLEDATLFLPSLSLTAAMGLFHGFSPMPNVGGILSLDLLGSWNGILEGGDGGLQGEITAWGIGARVGILRESFSLPGVSVTLQRQWFDEIRAGSLAEGDPAEARFQPLVTSLRGVVGKDVFGLGILAGGGWDRVEGDGQLGLRVSPSGLEPLTPPGEVSLDRAVFFVGGSKTFVVLHLAGEMGFSQSVDPELPVNPGGNHHPRNRAYFGSMSLRVTF